MDSSLASPGKARFPQATAACSGRKMIRTWTGPDSYNQFGGFKSYVGKVVPVPVLCLLFPSLFPRSQPDAQALGRRQLPRVAVLLRSSSPEKNRAFSEALLTLCHPPTTLNHPSTWLVSSRTQPQLTLQISITVYHGKSPDRLPSFAIELGEVTGA